MDVGKGAFSSKDMSVLFLALKTVSQAHLAVVTKHSTRLAVAGSRGALGPWGRDEVH